MTKISKEALLQLTKKGHKNEARRYIRLASEYLEFECVYETHKSPSRDESNKRDRMRSNICRLVLFLQSLTARENTKPLLSGVGRMLQDEIIDHTLVFAETLYSADKKRSFDEE
jgi:hypothetical protein